MWRTVSLSLAAVVLAYAAAAWLTLDFRVWTAEGARRLAVLRAPVPVPDVVLRGPGIDDVALPQLLRSEKGQVTLIDFIYTRCNSVCLALGSTFQQLQAALQADAQAATHVRLLSISFDPAHDSPSVLSAYAKQLRADSRWWRFAAPAHADALPQLLERFEVVVIPDGLGGYEHNAALLVVDAQGRLVRIFDYADMNLALAYARQLAVGR